MVGLHDRRALWSPIACHPRVSQEISRAGWMGGMSMMEQSEGKLTPKWFTEQLRFGSGCSHPLGAREELGFITLMPSVAFGSHL